jgi:C4-dicarboxylate transporter
VPGYVNDDLFGIMDEKLGSDMAACAYNEQESPEDFRQYHFALLPLTQLVQVAKGRKGMRFAYVHMSRSKAMLVGTLVTYMVQLATRLDGRA